VLCRAVPCLAVPCPAGPCRAVSCRAGEAGPGAACSALHCRALPCSALPCLALPGLAVPCRAMPCRAVPCRVVPCRVVPCRSRQPPVIPTFGISFRTDGQLLSYPKSCESHTVQGEQKKRRASGRTSSTACTTRAAVSIGRTSAVWQALRASQSRMRKPERAPNAKRPQSLLAVLQIQRQQWQFPRSGVRFAFVGVAVGTSPKRQTRASKTCQMQSSHQMHLTLGLVSLSESLLRKAIVFKETAAELS